MKALFPIALIILLGASCASKKKSDEKKVAELASHYKPAADRDEQYTRIVSMINNDTGLDSKTKANLVNLVDEYSVISDRMRQEQSQLSAALVNELLEGADGSTTDTILVTKQLEKLNSKKVKVFKNFIQDFKFRSGETMKNQNILMQDLGNLHSY